MSTAAEEGQKLAEYRARKFSQKLAEYRARKFSYGAVRRLVGRPWTDIELRIVAQRTVGIDQAAIPSVVTLAFAVLALFEGSFEAEFRAAASSHFDALYLRARDNCDWADALETTFRLGGLGAVANYCREEWP